MATPSTPPDESVERVYRVGENAQLAWIWLAVGAGLVGLAIVGLVVAIYGRVGQIQLQAMTTVPLVMAIASFAKGWAARQLPTEVRLDAAGIQIRRGNGEQNLEWEQLGWAAVEAAAVSQQRRLGIYDAHGKKIAAIAESFPDFDDLAARVKSQLSRRYGENNEAIRMRKARRSAILLTVISLFLLTIVFANLWLVRDKQRSQELLEMQGVPGEATIVRLFIAPNGITRRLEYEVHGDKGLVDTRNVEVTPEYWEALANAETVPIIFVPSEPDISRLVEGEVVEHDISDNPLVMYGLCLGLGLLCLVTLVAAAMQWMGWDIDFDSKTHKLSIKPFGTGN